MIRKKKSYMKYFFRSLKKEIRRILSIIAIVSLSVGFLIGLLSSTPDLQTTVNHYIKDYQVNDCFIKSTVGFSDEIICFLKEEIEDIDCLSVKSEFEANGKIDGNTHYFRLNYQDMHSESNNRLLLVEGRFPTKENECVLLTGNSSLISFNIQDTITFENGIIYTIVGKVHDPIYLSKGKIRAYDNVKNLQGIVYLNRAFSNDVIFKNVITEVNFTFQSLKKKDIFSAFYQQEIKKKIGEIEIILEENEWAEKNYRNLLRKQIIQTIKNELQNSSMSEESIEETLNSNLVLERIKQEENKQFFATFEQISPTFYVLSQQEIEAIYEFSINAEKVDSIASIFPVFFFAIAMLVCLSSFKRIISNEQVAIGTLKALGYENKIITIKYIMIGLFSILIGCLFGIGGGIFLLPYIIYCVYTPLYQLPPIRFTFQYAYIFGVTAVMLILNLLVVYYVTEQYVRRNSAILLNGESIKPGKKILLEKIPFIWDKMKFKYKSMFRNIFRFKKNLWMMILGVGGCSAILLTGFGLDDSLSVLTTNQYEEIFKYNLILETTEDDLYDLNNEIQILYLENGMINENRIYKTSLIGGDEKLNQFIQFENQKGKSLSFSKDSCFITSQISKKLKLKTNDSFIFSYQQKQYHLMVTDIVKNYVGNYIYIGDNLLSSLGINNKNALMAYKDFSNENVDEWFENLQNNEKIKSILFTNQYLETYNKLTNNLVGVVAILIVISGLLAIIVIYNLVDINIHERIKEIATLRVLGYQKREVVLYIFREIFVMSVFGFIIGILLGYFLHQYILLSISTPGLVFGNKITAHSYLYTGLLTVLFSLVVVIIFSPKIAKIHMAEALKTKE